MVITFGIFLIVIGCTKDESNKEKVNKTGSYLPEFIFDKDLFPPSPKGMIKVDGNDYEMSSGGFSWVNGDQAIEADALAPTQIAEGFDAIEAEPSSEISIEIEQNPKLSVYLWEDENKTMPIQLNATAMALPVEEGRYIYEVRATWENGKVSYTFVVEVK